MWGAARAAGRGGGATLAPPVLPTRGPRPVHPTHAGIDGHWEIRVNVTHGRLNGDRGPGGGEGGSENMTGGPGPGSGYLQTQLNLKLKEPSSGVS